jgi:Ca2+-binding EF-hand superfamily protein
MGSDISRMQMEDYKETTKGKFTEKEIRHMYKLFMRAASDDEMMGVKEFKLYIEGLGIFKRVDPQENYEQLFRGYDRDQSGTITFKEFLLYHLGIVHSTEELFDIVFAMYDADSNGFITRDEMVQVVTNATRWMGDCDVESSHVQKVIGDEVKRIFAFVDVDRDGLISRDELRNASKKHPEVLEKLKNLS